MNHTKFLQAQTEYYKLRDELRDELEPFGVTLSEWNILEIVYQNPGASVTDVAKILNSSLAYGTTSLDKLKDKGLVNKNSGTDKRSRCFACTDKGVSLIGQIREQIEADG